MSRPVRVGLCCLGFGLPGCDAGPRRTNPHSALTAGSSSISAKSLALLNGDGLLIDQIINLPILRQLFRLFKIPCASMALEVDDRRVVGVREIENCEAADMHGSVATS